MFGRGKPRPYYRVAYYRLICHHTRMKKIILLFLLTLSVVPTVLAAAPKTNVFKSITDALARSLTLKCEYTEGKNKVTAYIKKGTVRVDSAKMDEQGSGSVILKNYRMWTWLHKKKEGYVFDIPKTKENSVERRDKELISGLEKNRKFCKTAVVADNKFVPPTDVKFTNLADQLKKLKMNIPQVPNTEAEQ